MKRSISFLLFILAAAASAQERAYDPELAKKLGADERGMKMYVLCILKTGPKDGEIKGDERKKVFEGHFANIGKLADEGKLAVAGPFGKNDKAWRGLYIFNVATIEEAEKLVVLDPAVAAGVFVPELTLWYGSAAMMGMSVAGTFATLHGLPVDDIPALARGAGLLADDETLEAQTFAQGGLLLIDRRGHALRRYAIPPRGG